MTTFERDGHIIVPNFLLPQALSSLLAMVDSCPYRVNHQRPPIASMNPLTIAGSGSEARFKQIIRGEILRANQTIAAMYSTVASIATVLIGRALEPAPLEYWDSSLNCNIYERPGDHQGWHVDTNPVAALVFLASPPDVGLIVEVNEDNVQTVIPKPGDLVILDGTKPHCVSPIANERRINLSFNLYPPGEYSRPSQTDSLLYA